MKISELIHELNEIKNKEGDINVCLSESHEYWGTTYLYVTKYRLFVSDHAQPLGPKSGQQERAVVISHQ